MRSSECSPGKITAAIRSLSRVELVEDDRMRVSVSNRFCNSLAAVSEDRAKESVLADVEDIVRCNGNSFFSCAFPTVVGVTAVVGWDEEKKDGNEVLAVPAVTVPFLRRTDLPDGDL